MEDASRTQIITRYKNPLMRGKLDPNDYSYEDDNPLCGDHIRIELRVDENSLITEAAFSGDGCSVALASADILLESIIGKSIDKIRVLEKEYILDLLGMEVGPAREKCALLSLKILKVGVFGFDSLSDDLKQV